MTLKLFEIILNDHGRALLSFELDTDQTLAGIIQLYLYVSLFNYFNLILNYLLSFSRLSYGVGDFRSTI